MKTQSQINIILNDKIKIKKYILKKWIKNYSQRGVE
jgi:hypothetical protein